VLQTTHDDGHRRGNQVLTAGEIRLRRIPKNSPNGSKGYFTLDISVSEPNLVVTQSLEDDSHALRISTPRLALPETGKRHCISLEITAWLPEDAQFTDISIEATSLTIRMFEDTKISVSALSHFATISGKVIFPDIDNSSRSWDRARKEHKRPKRDGPTTPDTPDVPILPDVPTLPDAPEAPAPPNVPEQPSSQRPYTPTTSIPSLEFSSRRVSVNTVSGTISGNFPLYDYLGLTTNSGDITAFVAPKPVLLSAPKPAELFVKTISGTITVFSPISGPSRALYPRNYTARVITVSGDVKGSYLLGSQAGFHTTSGDINISILPVIEDGSVENPSKFHTYTVSGTTRINMFDPIHFPPPSSSPQYLADLATHDAERAKYHFRHLDSSHRSRSGDVTAAYPPAWEGTISATTMTGDITVTGSGVKTIRENNGRGLRQLVAIKGVEQEGQGSVVEIAGISTDVRFTVENHDY